LSDNAFGPRTLHSYDFFLKINKKNCSIIFIY
jgi:hypothetical protein